MISLRITELATKRLFILSILLCSCVSTKTVLCDKSASYPATEDVAIYAAASEIPYVYTLIGQVIGDGGLFGAEDKLLEKMIQKAKQLGADAIISPRFSKENEVVVWPGNQVQSYTVKNSSAEMIRFKRSESGQPLPRNK